MMTMTVGSIEFGYLTPADRARIEQKLLGPRDELKVARYSEEDVEPLRLEIARLRKIELAVQHLFGSLEGVL
jgi:hypothetical protein